MQEQTGLLALIRLIFLSAWSRALSRACCDSRLGSGLIDSSPELPASKSQARVASQDFFFFLVVVIPLLLFWLAAVGPFSADLTLSLGGTILGNSSCIDVFRLIGQVQLKFHNEFGGDILHARMT